MNENINSEASVKLLGSDINNKLTFDNHISTFFRKASNRLNSISRLQRCKSFKEKEILISSFAPIKHLLVHGQ